MMEPMNAEYHIPAKSDDAYAPLYRGKTTKIKKAMSIMTVALKIRIVI